MYLLLTVYCLFIKKIEGARRRLCSSKGGARATSQWHNGQSKPDKLCGATHPPLPSPSKRLTFRSSCAVTVHPRYAAYFLPVFSLLCPSVLDLGSRMLQTDRETDRQRDEGHLCVKPTPREAKA